MAKEERRYTFVLNRFFQHHRPRIRLCSLRTRTTEREMQPCTVEGNRGHKRIVAGQDDVVGAGASVIGTKI